MECTETFGKTDEVVVSQCLGSRMVDEKDCKRPSAMRTDDLEVNGWFIIELLPYNEGVTKGVQDTT